MNIDIRGDIVRHFRLERRKAFNDFCTETGVSKPTLTAIERAGSKPSCVQESTAMKIAEGLDVSVNTLRGEPLPPIHTTNKVDFEIEEGSIADEANL